MISLPVRQILGNVALSSIPANRQGLGARVKFVRGPRPVRSGLGFAAAPYMTEDGDFQDYWSANPPDFWGGAYDTWFSGGFEDWGGGWFYDPSTGVLYDQYGGGWDTWGGSSGSGYLDEFGSYTDAQGRDWIFNQNTGDYDLVMGDAGTIYSTTDEYITPTDYSQINDTLDWWGSIANGQTDVSDADLDVIISDGLHSLGGEYSGVQVPSTTAPKADKLALLKKIVAEAKKVLASKGGASGASSGGASSSKPVAPKADGTCPTGYVKNASGQCVKTAAVSNNLAGILTNPLYLALGAIGLILLAKK